MGYGATCTECGGVSLPTTEKQFELKPFLCAGPVGVGGCLWIRTVCRDTLHTSSLFLWELACEHQTRRCEMGNFTLTTTGVSVLFSQLQGPKSPDWPWGWRASCTSRVYDCVCILAYVCIPFSVFTFNLLFHISGDLYIQIPL